MDFKDVSGVSPIRCRHEIDLYGVKSGLGKFNPIMVENINKIPEPEEFEDPAILNKHKGGKRAKTVDKSGPKSGRNSNLNKSASKNNVSKMSNNGSPSKSSLNLVKMNTSTEKRTPSKLLLTN